MSTCRSTTDPARPLTVREHMALDLAGRVYRHPAVRVNHAREQLGYGETRFWQVVNALLDRPAAESAHPQLVRRLRRLRDGRQALRSRALADV